MPLHSQSETVNCIQYLHTTCAKIRVANIQAKDHESLHPKTSDAQKNNKSFPCIVKEFKVKHISI